jgi:hypothetical protein
MQETHREMEMRAATRRAMTTAMIDANLYAWSGVNCLTEGSEMCQARHTFCQEKSVTD